MSEKKRKWEIARMKPAYDNSHNLIIAIVIVVVVISIILAIAIQVL